MLIKVLKKKSFDQIKAVLFYYRRLFIIIEQFRNESELNKANTQKERYQKN
jgi:hypothetical protein